MKHSDLQLLRYDYFEQYKKELKVNLWHSFSELEENEDPIGKINYYFASSSTYSSNIEGNSVSFESYVKNKTFNLSNDSVEVGEIDDLIEAHVFAQENEISSKAILQSHKIFAKDIIPSKKDIGVVRKTKAGVASDGKLIYSAIEPENAEEELRKLFLDIKYLSNEKLSIEETFYFAAMIHLVFVNIHPFVDGNGRATRLLEKWFLATKLGPKGWNIASEKNYFENRGDYYKNLQLGKNYSEVNYALSIPFLLMLPQSLAKW
jgi:Fic family protein